MRPGRHTVPAKRIIPGVGASNLSVIITHAAMGKRMKSYGPKALFTLNDGTTILERQLKIIWEHFPNADIIVIVGFETHKIRNYIQNKYPIRLVFNPLFEETNVMYSLSLGLHCCITNHIIIMHGDLVFNSLAVKGITDKGSKVPISKSPQIKDDKVGLIYDETTKNVTNFSYGLPIRWGQIVYLEEKELKIFKKLAHNHDTTRNWFLYQALNSIVEQKGQLKIHNPIGMEIGEVSQIKDLEMVRKI
jgi:choline kinase